MLFLRTEGTLQEIQRIKHQLENGKLLTFCRPGHVQHRAWMIGTMEGAVQFCIVSIGGRAGVVTNKFGNSDDCAWELLRMANGRPISFEQ